jgi:hypothetical protein
MRLLAAPASQHASASSLSLKWWLTAFEEENQTKEAGRNGQGRVKELLCSGGRERCCHEYQINHQEGGENVGIDVELDPIVFVVCPTT